MKDRYEEKDVNIEEYGYSASSSENSRKSIDTKKLKSNEEVLEDIYWALRFIYSLEREIKLIGLESQNFKIMVKWKNKFMKTVNRDID